MCTHRAEGRWGKVWNVWLVAVIGSFAAAEATALVSTGQPGTLSAYVRRAAGLDPRCRHSHVGRGVIVAFFTWAAVHLGWGVLGVGGRRCLRPPLSRLANTADPSITRAGPWTRDRRTATRRSCARL